MVEIYPQMCWGERTVKQLSVYSTAHQPPFFFGILCKFVDFVDSMTLKASLTCSNKQQIRSFFFFRVVNQMSLQVKKGREASQVLEVMLKSAEMNAERHVVSVLVSAK
jgi:hypothetical protein